MCQHRGFGTEDCTHSEDVAVSCRSSVTNSASSGKLPKLYLLIHNYIRSNLYIRLDSFNYVIVHTGTLSTGAIVGIVIAAIVQFICGAVPYPTGYP